MVKFLTTRGISAGIEQIINDAQESLVLISPYIKAHPTIKERLERKSRDGFDIHLVCREKNLEHAERDWLRSMPFMKVSYRENLHAKCYMNEHEALVTSMNLYGYSEVNNEEMGLLVSLKEDRRLYEQITDEVLRIVEGSRDAPIEEAQAKTEHSVGSPLTRGMAQANRTSSVAPKDRNVTATAKPQSRPSGKALSRPSAGVPSHGFCIRCKTEVPTDPSKPYCRRCYTTWELFENPEYEEKHCHTCGSEHTSTLLKPVCLSCYRKYKDVFEFAVG